MVTWDERGIKLEACQRHAEIIVKQMKGHTEGKMLSSLSRKLSSRERRKAPKEELKAEMASKCRAVSAKGTYLAQDKTDIRYAVRELWRRMSKSREVYFVVLMRFAKYLKGKERYVNLIDYHPSSAKNSNKFIPVWVETDCAGWPETRNHQRRIRNVKQLCYQAGECYPNADCLVVGRG